MSIEDGAVRARAPARGLVRLAEGGTAAMNLFARAHGYALVVKRSIYDKKNVCRRVIYACDRHGERRRDAHKPRAGGRQQPNATSRRCGCPMEVNVMRLVATGRWIVQYRGMETTHNHAPSSSPAAHPIHRRADRTPEVLAAIVVDARAGEVPAQTLACINESHPAVVLCPRDIYNERQRARRMGLTEVQEGDEHVAAPDVDSDSNSSGQESGAITSDDGTHELPCPPIATYSSPKEAQAAMNLFAHDRGYALVVKRSIYDKKGACRRVIYACDRHGKRRDSHVGAKQRLNASSRRCGCPMEVNVVRVIATGQWEIQHRGTETMHNHEPSPSAASHPIHWRADRTPDVLTAIVADAESGATAAKTLARISEGHPTMALSARDIYNERQRVRRMAAAQRFHPYN